MAKKQNTTRQNRSGAKKANASRPGFVVKAMTFLRSAQGRKTAALILLLTGLFLFIAFLSHFFTGKEDQSLEGPGGLPGEVVPANWLGSVGAWFAQKLVFGGFGVMAFCIPVFMGILAVALLENNYYKFAWSSFKYLLFATLWGACFFAFMAFLLKQENGQWGGSFGWYVNEGLFNYIGVAGVGLLMAIIFLIFLVLNFDLELPVIKGIKNLFSGEVKEVKKTEESDQTSEEAISRKEEPAEEDDFQLSVKKPDPETTPETSEEDKIDLSIPPEHELPVLTDSSGEEKEGETGGLELQINEGAEQDKELPIAPVESGDNIYKTQEDTYEKIVPEEDQEALEAGEDVGDWEEFDPTLELSDYQYPTIDLLRSYETKQTREVNRAELENNKNKIVKTLMHYKIEIKSIKATIGPTVTLYEIVPAPGIRISKIKGLEDDIALSLAALGIRIIAPIPGKGTIGIEIPNSNPEIVSMRNVLATEKFRDTKAELPLALGRTISNEVLIADLAKMPHLLIAGATGQGKSVGINGLLSSLLYKKHPAQVKFVLIDPKKVELSLYTALEKHFLAKLPSYDEPIITDTKQVVSVLNSLCIEMDSRYDLLKKAKVRNIKEYNEKFVNRRLNPRKGHRYMPYIVLVIDEFADLMMTAGKEVEAPIARLAQLARAIGIHLILATQRPSVNVITGIIKANFPARISYRVTSKVDSRTILDSGGADQLIGRGDMLLSTGSDITRIQNAFIDTPEVDKLTEFISSQRGYTDAYFLPEVPNESDEEKEAADLLANLDSKFEEAAKLIVRHQQGSTSLIQRKLKLGYNRSGRIIDQLEAAGIVGPFSGSKARDVLVSDEYQLEQILNTLN